MQALTKSGRRLTPDIKAMKWLPLDAAIERLALPLERVFLRNVGPRALERKIPSLPEMAIDEAPDHTADAPATPDVVTPISAPPNMAADMPAMPETPAAVAMAPEVRRSFFQRVLGAFRRA
jgi:8-oxo-dGTP diphosphatase